MRDATETDRLLHEARGLQTESKRLSDAGKYTEALPPAEKALELRERVRGAEHPDLYHPLLNLAVINYLKGNYANAETLCLRALMITENALGPEHPLVARLLYNFAVFYSTRGDDARAEPLLQRALPIQEKALGPDHPHVGHTLNRLATLSLNKGGFVSAESLFQRSLMISETALGEEHDDVAQALNSLAGLYRAKGDYVKAEPFYQRALVLYEKTRGTDHPYLAPPLHNLATLYRDMGEFDKAERLYQRAISIREKVVGPNHPNVAGSRASLALLYYNRGDYVQAEPLYLSALATLEKVLGPNHPLVAWHLSNLAKLYFALNRDAKAEPLYRRALAIFETAYGTNSYYLADIFVDLAKMSAAEGKRAQAVAFQARANAIIEYHLDLNLATGSERQKLAYLATLPEQMNRAISLHVRFAVDDGAARELAATTVLQRKGRVQDALSQSLASLRARFSAEDQALLDQLNGVTSRLARLVLNEPQGASPAEHQKQIRSFEERREKLESEISSRSAGFYERAQPITLAAVQAAIPEQAALVEFAVHRPFDPKKPDNETAYGEPRYIVYVIRHQGEVRWTELGAAKEIDSAIDALRQALRDPRRKDAQQIARAVDDKLMRPVRAIMGEVTQLLVSPDGALNLIPFEALVDEQGRYLVERYSFAYLTSGRDLLRMQVARANGSEPLVVANPSFGEPAADQLASAARSAMTGNKRRRSVTNASNLSETYFAPLGGTAEEARTIQTLFPEANLLTRARATESALKQIAAPRLLHIATHGFFLSEPGAVATGSVAQVTARGINPSAQSVPGAVATGSVAQVTARGINTNAQSVPGAVATGSVAQARTRGINPSAQSVPGAVATGSVAQVTARGINANVQSVPGAVATGSVAQARTRGINPNAKIDNPLLRSGLALAGANLRGGATSDDGILTALEASGLNLWGTKLVVLSACDTGLGEVRNGEGVYGLRRAFVLAGAESMIMSLWPVSDYATRKLMTDYYKNLKQGMGRGAALRQVQLDMLRRNRQLHPFYWANFIQSGEWANLDGKR